MNICICQLIKDEQRYIEEWIDYYLNFGISKFILFEDRNSTSHKDILSKYGDKIIIHRYDDVVTDDDTKYFTETRQEVIWSVFLRMYKDKFDACLFIDPDEYIGCTPEEFLEEINHFKNDPNVYSIYYKWLTHTASGHIKDPYPNQKYSVVKTYTKVLYGYNMRDKLSEYDYKDYNLQCKHLIYLYKLKNITDFHVPHGNACNEQESVFKLNHYLMKSWEEYKWRLFNKGEQVKMWARRLEDFFELNQDLLPYKEELINECKELNYKYNDEI